MNLIILLKALRTDKRMDDAPTDGQKPVVQISGDISVSVNKEDDTSAT